MWHVQPGVVGLRCEQGLRVRYSQESRCLRAPVDTIDYDGSVGGEFLGEVGHIAVRVLVKLGSIEAPSVLALELVTPGVMQVRTNLSKLGLVRVTLKVSLKPDFSS